MIVAFVTLLLFGLVFAFVRGGTAGRIVACCFVLAAAATAILAPPSRFEATHFLPGLFVVDTALFVALASVALWSRKKWAGIIAALQLNAVACHLAVFVAKDIDPNLYYGMLTIWSVPIMLIFIVGTYFESRRTR